MEKEGHTCEDLLSEMNKLYTPHVLQKKRKVIAQVMNFTRNSGENLKDATHRMNGLLMECEKVKYEPGEDIKMVAINKMMTTEESTIVNMLATKGQCVEVLQLQRV
eukprot:GHVR01114167.1.p1 GENE.GHVR01114167.1~~GHVR01114167.1.p1  ORF type:complete len:106 (+),score=20.90 GHVR01114167.1:676-993(+)